MGKRKLRFDTRKNYERKKSLHCQTVQSAASGCVRPVSVPITSCEAAHMDSHCEENDVRVLPVRIPASLYMTRPVPDIPALHKQLLESKCLPSGWVCSVTSNTSLALCKLTVPEGLASAKIAYMVTVSCDFSWKVSIEFQVQENVILHTAPTLLTSAMSVMNVVEMLDSYKVCVGNSDEKFSRLIAQRNGKFMDKTGNSVHDEMISINSYMCCRFGNSGHMYI